MSTLSASEGTFNITQNGNVLQITLEGRIVQELADKFAPAFQAAVGKIQPANTELKLDVSKVNVVGTDMQGILKSTFGLYKSIGFKKITFIHGNNAILRMQSRRIAKEAGLTNLEVL